MNVFNVMICSPNDVDEERIAIRDAIDTANRLLDRDAVVLKNVSWENVPAQSGGKIQELINKASTDKTNIFVFVLASKIGGKGWDSSGTAEEILIALEKLSLGVEPVQILLFVANYGGDQIEIDIDQLTGIQKAIKLISDAGSKYERFKTVEELKTSSLIALVNAAKLLVVFEPKISVAKQDANPTTIEPLDEDLGILELNQQVVARLELASASVNRVNDALAVATSKTNKWQSSADQFKALKIAPAIDKIDEVSIIIEELTASIRPENVSILEDQIPGFEAVAILVSELAQTESFESDRKLLIESVTDGCKQLEGFIESLEGAVVPILALPNMTGRLKRAKKEFGKTMNSYTANMRSSFEVLQTIAE
jgi:hypothetical protein